MAGATVDTATGITVAFGTSNFASELLDAAFGDISRVAHEVTHQGTAVAGANKFGNKIFIPDPNVDPGTVELTFHFDPDKWQSVPPIEQAAETITFTWPKPSGTSSAAVFAFSGFVINASINAAFEEKMTFTLTIKITGNVTMSAAS